MRALVVLLAVLVACGGGSGPIGPTDRPWDVADFQRLARTDGCGALPHHGSAAFARMTEPAVLERLDVSSRDLLRRMPPLLEYMEALRDVAHRYAVCGTVLDNVAVGTAMLELFARLLPAMGEFLATIPPDDPTYQVRAEGLEQMKRGVVGVATGLALTTRGSRLGGSAPGLGGRIGTALARLEAQLPPGALSPALGNLDVPEDGDDDPHRRALRAELRAALHAARVPASAR